MPSKDRSSANTKVTVESTGSFTSTHTNESSTTAAHEIRRGGFTDTSDQKTTPRNQKQMPHKLDTASSNEFADGVPTSLSTGYAQNSPETVTKASTSGTGSEGLGRGDLKAWLFADVTESFAEKKEFQEGDMVDIQIMRVGKWQHPLYGKVEVSEKTLVDVVSNFKSNERGVDLAVDENHEPNHKALAWFRDVYQKGKDTLFATLELTKRGAELLTEGAYKYFSPEIIFKKVDEESGEQVKNLLVGGAFTNRPFFKRMTPLMANEDGAAVNYQNHIYLFTNNTTMMGFMEKLSALDNKESVTTEEFNELKAVFETLEESHKEAYSELVAKVEEKVEAFDESAAEEEAAEEPAATEEEEAPAEETAEEATEEAEETPAEEEAPEAEEVAATEEVSSAEFNEMKAQLRAAQKELAQKNRALRFSENEQKVRGFAFSESNESGVLAPAMINKVAEFATNLSEKQAVEFFSILENVRTDLAAKTKEIGSTGAVIGEFAEVKSFYMNKMGFSEEQADKAVEDYKAGLSQ